MESSRRKFLIGTSIAAGGVAVAGYNETLSHVVTMNRKGKKAADAIYGNAASPELVQKDGNVMNSIDYALQPSVCNGCTTHCSVRVKINKKTNTVERVFGNPYSLLSSDPWLPYKTPLKESFKLTSSWQESGLDMRSTACARGNLVY